MKFLKYPWMFPLAFGIATDALQNALGSMRRLDLSPAAGR